jgi:hypothetical protein
MSTIVNRYMIPTAPYQSHTQPLRKVRIWHPSLLCGGVLAQKKWSEVVAGTVTAVDRPPDQALVSFSLDSCMED